MEKLKNHWKKIILLLFLLIIVVFLWPRPISSLVPKDVSYIIINTTDFIFENGDYGFQHGLFKYDTEEEINLVLDTLYQHTFHYTPKKYTDAFLSAVFAVTPEHGEHGDQTLPEHLEIWLYYNNNDDSISLSTWGDGYLKKNGDSYYRIGYFGKKKGILFFNDVMNLLTDEYKMKATTITKEDGSTITHWE